MGLQHKRQTTLRSQVTLSGIGAHSGKVVTMTLGPAEAGLGYLFVRTDQEREVRAAVTAVTATAYATVLGDADGALVSTAEHVLATLRSLGVDNATIEVDGSEIPIFDGSAQAIVEAIDDAGIVTLHAPRRYIEVLKPVSAAFGESFGELSPSQGFGGGFSADIEIDFRNAVIGRQRLVFTLTPDYFRRELARARTFGCKNDVARLWEAGYARGSSLDNAIVYDDNRVLNPEGLRFADEFVRHKALDAVGDLALAGLPIRGHYRSLRGGHKLNHAVLAALMADSKAYRIVEEAVAPMRSRGQAGVIAQIAPAYGPDVS